MHRFNACAVDHRLLYSVDRNLWRYEQAFWCCKKEELKIHWSHSHLSIYSVLFVGVAMSFNFKRTSNRACKPCLCFWLRLDALVVFRFTYNFRQSIAQRSARIVHRIVYRNDIKLVIIEIGLIRIWPNFMGLVFGTISD